MKNKIHRFEDVMPKDGSAILLKEPGSPIFFIDEFYFDEQADCSGCFYMVLDLEAFRLI